MFRPWFVHGLYSPRTSLVVVGAYLLNLADMPPGTDCPYPIRILAFFEMIDTAVSPCDTDLRQNTEKQFMHYV